MAVDSEALLRVSHLTKTYPMPGSGFKRQAFTAVDDLSFEIAPGEVYGLVGESGSGKSTTGRLICGLERADSGSIAYRGHDLATMSERERKPFRREIQLVFQDSSTAFDPRNRVGRILEEPLIIAGVRDADERHERALSALASVGLLAEHYDRYPHDLSGGDSASDSIWHGRLFASRALWYATSRSRRLTCPFRPKCSTYFATCSARRAWRCCLSRMICVWFGICPTGLACSTTVALSRKARPRT